MVRVRKHIQVSGIVQGVGFRPFVYAQALQHGLGGWVGNNSRGVFIEAEGDAESVETFLRALRTSKPRPARIDAVETTDLQASGDSEFRIVESQDAGGCETSIPPDLALCEDCRREMLDPSDRRFRYPFINCTNCGPRFTIVTGIPYDRPNTTMARFAMCEECRREYEDPIDRRYHAQPIACPACGPRIELRNPAGEVRTAADPIHEAAVRLQQGEIIAVKGLGGFHLACDATSESTVRRLRSRKRRPRRPLAVMAPSLDEAHLLAEIDPAEAEVLTGVERPIVLLRKRPDAVLPDSVAPGLDEIGVILPYTPLHELLCRDAGTCLVMTSGNLSDEPLCTGNEEALNRLDGIADWFLLHDRDIARPCDDSVVRLWRGRRRFSRRSRGYVPHELALTHSPSQNILAIGGDLKNTCCLTKGDRATLSQHLGDMEFSVSQEHAVQTRRDLETLIDAIPTTIVSDRHPAYFTRRMADEAASEKHPESVPLHTLEVQHHHAHLASCLAEHGRDEEVLALTWDGTGYGDDGSIWGGEILLGDLREYRRVGFLETILLAGGDRAVKETWRVGLAWLYRAMPHEAAELAARFFSDVSPERLGLVTEALSRQLRTTPCCSMGRLFDAVAALAGLASTVTYEGEAAIGLEHAARRSPPVPAYGIELQKLPDGIQWGFQPLFREVVRDRLDHRPIPQIARAFHDALIVTAQSCIRQLTQRLGKRAVVLSGGCFQNLTLLEGITAALEADGVEVLTHADVPCNDGGIAYGQANIAAAQML